MVEPTPQVPRPSIQGLSDLIFGLALSIGAIQLITTQSLPQNPTQLVGILGAFGFSFLILISVWNRYTITMSVMPAETPGLVRLNMVLLFMVVIEPYLFNLLYIQGLGSPVGQQVSSYYAIDLAGMNLILAYFTHVLANEEKNLIPKGLIWRFKLTRDVLIAASLVFLYSGLPGWWTAFFLGFPDRIVIWFLALPITWLPRLGGVQRLFRSVRPESRSETPPLRTGRP